MTKYFLQGNEACALGAIKAGCRFYAGYPITPSSEIMEQMARELPKVGGVFVQMEDEIGSMGAVIGATWAGAKAMTATSGPGLTLMLENIGYAIMTETPCVIVDVQRAGPSTGQATKPASGDVMQVRWGASGDYEIIALSPWSVAEMYEMTIQAFNLAETYRVPVFLLADEAVGHLRESAELKEDIEVIPRACLSEYARSQAGKTDLPPFGNPEDNPLYRTQPIFNGLVQPPVGAGHGPPLIRGNYNPLPLNKGGWGVVPMPAFGQGRKLSVTGSTHDEWGYRKTQSPEAQAKSVDRFCNKITKNIDKIASYEQYFMDGATEIVIAYGFTARSALKAVQTARANGHKVGLIRLKTLWPFPEKIFDELPETVRKILVPEMNQGQIVREIQRLTAQSQRSPDYFGNIPVEQYNKTNGTIITASEILAEIV